MKVVQNSSAKWENENGHQLSRDSLVALMMNLIAADSGTPTDVRTRVTSPGGLTAECIATLEQYGFRTAVLQAILAGLRKTKEFSVANHSPIRDVSQQPDTTSTAIATQ